MIDPLNEDLIWPTGATRLFSKGPNGKHPHVSFVYRAMKSGCRGVLLESVRIPRLATSRQAVARFILRLSGTDRAPCHNPRSIPALERVNQETESELDRLGI